MTEGAKVFALNSTGSSYSYAGVGANELWYYSNGNFGALTFGSDGAVPIKFISNGSERMRIDSSGNLLVGQTTATTGSNGVYLRSNSDSGFNVTNGNVISLNRLSSDGQIAQFRKDGTTVGSIGSVNGVTLGIDGGSTRSGLQFNSSGVDPRKGQTLADATVDLGQSAYRYRNLYLSGGVYLGGTGSANHLDDYEEGSFMPTIIGSSTAGTGTYTVQVGSYVKVGNVVHVQGYLSWTGHTGTGDMRIATLPFSASTTSNNYGVMSTAYQHNITLSSGYYLTGSYISPATNTGILTQSPTGGGSSIPVTLDTNAQIMFTATYHVA
jgi:hypothetical protein